MKIVVGEGSCGIAAGAANPDERKVLCVGTFGNNESFFTMKGIANTIAESIAILNSNTVFKLAAELNV